MNVEREIEQELERMKMRRMMGYTEQDSPEQRLLKIKEEEHQQAMRERQQRQKIGRVLALIVIALPIYLLMLLWAFIYTQLDSIDPKMWTFVTFMFSSTYIAVVMLYGGLIAALFQKISSAKTDADKENEKTDNDTSFNVLKRMESMLEKLIKNSGNL